MYHVIKVYKDGSTYIESLNNCAMSHEVAVIVLQQLRATESSKNISYKLCKVMED